jgi:hypothetical protein
MNLIFEAVTAGNMKLEAINLYEKSQNCHYTTQRDFLDDSTIEFHIVQVKSSCITIYGQSASLSWCQAPISDPRPIFSFFLYLFSYICGFNDAGALSLTRNGVCSSQFLFACNHRNVYYRVSIYATCATWIS